MPLATLILSAGNIFHTYLAVICENGIKKKTIERSNKQRFHAWTDATIPHMQSRCHVTGALGVMWQVPCDAERSSSLNHRPPSLSSRFAKWRRSQMWETFPSRQNVCLPVAELKSSSGSCRRAELSWFRSWVTRRKVSVFVQIWPFEPVCLLCGITPHGNKAVDYIQQQVVAAPDAEINLIPILFQ